MTHKGCKQKPAFQPNNPCPSCGSTHIGHMGNRWKCFDCNKSWMKQYKPKVYVTRPDTPCPRCGSVRVRSHGKDWVCLKCGRTWVKIRRKILLKKEDLLLLKDKPQSKIADILGCSQSAVSLAMKRFGIKANPKHVWTNRNPEKQKQINKKISKALKGNTNWRFSHQYPNSEEKKLIRFFEKWNLPFEYVGDGSFKVDGKCPDFIWGEKQLIIEFFGELWHKSSDEKNRIDFFKKRGWNCLIVWGKETGSYFKTYKTYAWERRLYDKIIRWLAGLDQT